MARHLGIAESTLRSWHRRYGIEPQGSEPGRYRRYSQADVARLRQMLDLIKLGMLASEAARAVQAGEPEAVPPERDVAELVAAARAADSERCRIVLDNVLVRRGVVQAWEAVCRPALALVDADQRDDPDCMDIEHALSWAMLAALHRVPTPPIAPGAPLILLACVEAEHHTLPLAALAAALGAHRIPVRMLGAATPTSSLVRAIRQTAPAAVVLWSQRPDTAGRYILQLLASYPVSVFTAGPGWPAPDRDDLAAHLEGSAADLEVLEPSVDRVEHLAGLPSALAALTSPAARVRAARGSPETRDNQAPQNGQESHNGQESQNTQASQLKRSRQPQGHRQAPRPHQIQQTPQIQQPPPTPKPRQIQEPAEIQKPLQNQDLTQPQQVRKSPEQQDVRDLRQPVRLPWSPSCTPWSLQ